MEQLLLINPENIADEEANGYPIREAARAVVVDESRQIALLHVSKSNYFKLPGGGIESSEDRMVALRRKCLEPISKPFEEAISALRQRITNNAEARDYIVPRDTAFLQAAGKLL